MKIISEKDLRITTLAGAAIMFQAGDPITVSDEIGLLAIQAGAKEYNSKFVEEQAADIAEFEEVREETVVPEAVPLDTELVTALERMMDEGDPKNFKADGSPKAGAVNKVMGETVDADTREAAWESILNS